MHFYKAVLSLRGRPRSAGELGGRNAGQGCRQQRSTAITLKPVDCLETVARTAKKPCTFTEAVLETILATVVKPVTFFETVVLL